MFIIYDLYIIFLFYGFCLIYLQKLNKNRIFEKFLCQILLSHLFPNFKNVFLLVLPNEMVVNPNSWYISMHLDRLSDELLSGTYGKQEEEVLPKKKKQTKNKNEKITD